MVASTRGRACEHYMCTPAVARHLRTSGSAVHGMKGETGGLSSPNAGAAASLAGPPQQVGVACRPRAFVISATPVHGLPCRGSRSRSSRVHGLPKCDVGHSVSGRPASPVPPALCRAHAVSSAAPDRRNNRDGHLAGAAVPATEHAVEPFDSARSGKAGTSVTERVVPRRKTRCGPALVTRNSVPCRPPGATSTPLRSASWQPKPQRRRRTGVAHAVDSFSALLFYSGQVGRVVVAHERRTLAGDVLPRLSGPRGLRRIQPLSSSCIASPCLAPGFAGRSFPAPRPCGARQRRVSVCSTVSLAAV